MNYPHKILIIISLVLYLPCPSIPQENNSAKKITVITTDFVRLTGIFSLPANNKKTIFILLHGLGSNKEEWLTFTKKLSDEGYGSLCFDARGHGESTLTQRGKKIDYRLFGPPGPVSEWNKMILDLGELVNFVSKKYNVPRKNIGLIGASLGANISLVYAAQNKSICPIILLSPGLNYAGIRTDNVISQFKDRPIAIAASSNDPYAYSSSISLLNKITANKNAVFFQGSGGHGVQMFDGNLENKLLRWLERY